MDRGKWIAAVALFVSLAALDLAASGFALDVPSLGTSGLTGAVPSTTVPSVSTPSVGTPDVTTPQSTVPHVGSPSVTTKDQTTTKLSTPTITTQSTVDAGSSVDGVTAGTSTGGTTRTLTNVVSAPESAAGGTTGSPISGTGDSSSSGSLDGGPGSQNPSGSGGVAPGAGTGSVGGPSGGLGGPSGPADSNDSGLRAFALLPGGAAALRLRATLEPLLGCFYSLSPFEQEVLTLRAGLDGGAPISRAQLASAFGVTPVAVHRTERSALRQLRRASDADGCVSVAASALTVESGFISGPFGPVGYVSPTARPTMRAALAANRVDLPGPVVESRSLADRLEELGGDGGSGPHWMVFLITLLLCASLGALLRQARRSV